MLVEDNSTTGSGRAVGLPRFREYVCLIVLTFIISSCGQLEHPKSEPFYAQTAPPTLQEFRWSNGKSPKSLDPAKAAAAPETDIVRAIYEGLTELDPKTLKEIPAVAEKWESSPDLRTWTFHLRKEARWSNGEPVVADDFVRSWRRLVDLKTQTANKYLFENIVGMKTPLASPLSKPDQPADFLHDTPAHQQSSLQKMQAPTSSVPVSQPTPRPEVPGNNVPEPPSRSEPPKFGVEAVDQKTLRVTLELPDKDFPKLVANPIFRPIFGDGAEMALPELDAGTISNGAFHIASIADNGILLERSETYWDRRSVGLQRVRIVPTDTAEKALEAYRSGSIDAVSNADFEPLALKLLAPFEDFRRTTHSALNYYEINARSTPFADRRVRAALAISIDRERLTEGELEGSTQPAYSFLPLGDIGNSALSLDVDRAKDLLAKAGYPNGQNFPQIRLVVNRNDTQQRVARTVAKMWRQNLNLDTLIIVKEPADMETIRQSGDFDLIRRGVVIPTVDEFVSLSLLFGSRGGNEEQASLPKKGPETSAEMHSERNPAPSPVKQTGLELNEISRNLPTTPNGSLAIHVPTEERSLFDIYAIPLYFPTSYALVRPYVSGFDVNGLDAPWLKSVTIDNDWQLKASSSESK